MDIVETLKESYFIKILDKASKKIDLFTDSLFFKYTFSLLKLTSKFLRHIKYKSLFIFIMLLSSIITFLLLRNMS
ncbi:hypothetical protein COV16_00335 [Candidatus Woesearchaeota archaeon CG10_big_fil_rev_8_21_14_0_10_34_8]|nr:MAG: hypothetical protein COV16_00335 [Candidatus Woesearchaeota archaeon CG10_big_fil_rev_8_21_14_0_10_34_8]